MRTTAMLIGLLVLAGAAPAVRAQTFTWAFYEAEGTGDLTDAEFAEYLNLGRCLCDEARGNEDDAYLWVKVTQTSGTYDGGDVFFYLGDDCTDNAISITEQCYELAVIPHASFQNEQWIPIPVNRIVNPMGGTCTSEAGGSTTIYLIIGDRTNDHTDYKPLSWDTRGESPPTGLEATGGEGAVTLSWTPPDNNSDIEYYDVLCSLDGTPVPGLSSESKADWVSSREVCDKELFVGDATQVASAPDCASETGGLGAGNAPSPCYVCSSLPLSSTSVRISGLVNGQSYSFAVVSVDKQGNVSLTSEVVTATPEITTDFAEHYKDSGGAEDGGFCFVATAVYGDYHHPEVVRLRGFRDDVLSRSAPGRRFIQWYYANGRSLAALQGIAPEAALLARVGVAGLGWLAGLARGTSRSPEGSLPLGVLLLGLTLSLARSRRQPGPEDASSAGDDAQHDDDAKEAQP